ncbi:MAG: hypothetical protein JNJ83_08325 [Verrucomicrobiaceae bacterium]|nr:hypothetical protein [Verrucomicrobiaceae bacterium]
MSTKARDSLLAHLPGRHKVGYTPARKDEADEEQEVTPGCTRASPDADPPDQAKDRSEHRHKNARAKKSGAGLLIGGPASLHEIIQCRNICLTAPAAATTQSNLGNTLATKTTAA